MRTVIAATLALMVCAFSPLRGKPAADAPADDVLPEGMLMYSFGLPPGDFPPPSGTKVLVYSYRKGAEQCELMVGPRKTMHVPIAPVRDEDGRRFAIMSWLSS